MIKRKNKKAQDTRWIDDVLDDDYKLARWAALIDAIDLINGHGVDRNKKFEDIDLKPLAITKYIDFKADTIYEEICRNKTRQKV